MVFNCKYYSISCYFSHDISLVELKICCDHNFLLAKKNSEGTSGLK